MARPYIEKIRIQNYGCIQDAEIQLTPLHALIGPNDSGKSTVLRALRTVASIAPGFKLGEDEWNRVLSELRYRERDRNVSFTVFQAEKWWSLSLSNATFIERTGAGKADIGNVAIGSQLLQEPALKSLTEALRGATVLRADPDEMRRSSSLIPDGRSLRFASERGEGLPGVYDAILVRDRPAYVQINETVKKFFPTVKGISAKNPTGGTKAIGVQLLDGTFVPAEHMSEGLLYFLAFAALPYLEPTSLLLIEEPENGRARTARARHRFRSRRSTWRVSWRATNRRRAGRSATRILGARRDRHEAHRADEESRSRSTARRCGDPRERHPRNGGRRITRESRRAPRRCALPAAMARPSARSPVSARRDLSLTGTDRSSPR